jgi:putative lipoprotein
VTARILGSVTYQERIALPPGSTIEITLNDVGVAPAQVAAKTIVTKGEQVPILFELGYNRAQILAGHKYAISARITKDGRLLFGGSLQLADVNVNPSTRVNIVAHPPVSN